MTKDVDDFGKHEQALVSTLALLREAAVRTVAQRADIETKVFADGSTAQWHEVVKLVDTVSTAFSGLLGAALLLELALLGRVSPPMRKLFDLLGKSEGRHAFTIAKDILAEHPDTLRKIRDKMIEDAMAEDDA